MIEIAFILEARTGDKLKEPSINRPGASSSGAQPMDVDALTGKGGQQQWQGGKYGGAKANVEGAEANIDVS